MDKDAFRRASFPLRDWTEDDWIILLNHIENGQVIPIVGRDLLRLQCEGEESEVLLHTHIAKLLVERVQGSSASLPSLSLNEAVFMCLAKRLLPQEISFAVRSILQTLKTQTGGGCKIPIPLQHLAQITDFRIFVSTTFDSLLQRAIENFRDHRQAPRVFAFDPKPSGGRRIEDLPPAADRFDGRPCIYHLMGLLDVDSKRFDPGNVVLTDEDLLEFICALLSENRERVPVNLINELSSKHLLLLGCNFSDWLARFFLKATRRNHAFGAPNEPAPGPTIQYVVDDLALRDENLVLFVEQFWPTTRIYRTQNVVGFLKDLNGRWCSRNPGKVPSPTDQNFLPEFPNKGIFISYAREDEQAAKQLFRDLDNFYLPVWLDQASLNPGDEYKRVIMENLSKCKVFLPLISKNSLTRTQDSNLAKEWQMAVKRSEGPPPDRSFSICPVVIDNTSLTDERIPSEFRLRHSTMLRDGTATRDFFQKLARHVRLGG